MTEARLQETTRYSPGTFCWVELGTTNGDAAKKFYTSLFGWEYVDNPVGAGMVYTMLKLEGKDVGALYQLPGEMLSQGVPTSWLSYVSVANTDDSAKKAKTAGGTIMKESFDVMDVGRMAVVQDPTGAVFALWQARKHQGAGITNVPNSFCWNELLTSDTTKAGKFYNTLFGWNQNVQEFGPIAYTTFMNGARPAGGMFKPTPEMGNVPPHWIVYFAVDNCDTKTQKALGLGAKTIVPPSDIPGIGRFAIIKDPQGADFGIIKLTQPPS